MKKKVIKNLELKIEKINNLKTKEIKGGCTNTCYSNHCTTNGGPC